MAKASPLEASFFQTQTMLSVAENYFAQFGLPVGYDVDLSQLDTRFRELQTIVHPDRHAAAEEAQRLRAVKLSGYLNEAHQTLKSPLRRAGYLLRLGGVDTEKVEQSDLSPELLMEQISLRESLAELPRDESAFDRLEELGRSTRAGLRRREVDFKTALAEEELGRAKRLFHEMQFLSKLRVEIEKAEDALV